MTANGGRLRESNIILVGIVAAIALAGLSLLVFGQKMIVVKVLGDFFLDALKMIVVPLVMASVIVGITSLGDVRRLGGVGGRTIAFYAATTALSVATGLVLVLLIRPGMGVSTEGLEVDAGVAAKGTIGVGDILLSFVHPNIIGALAEAKILPVIVFSLFLGGILTTLGGKGAPVIAFFDGLNEAMMKFVGLIMWIAPIGIFGLVAGKFAEMPPDQWGQVFAAIGKYIVTVLVGLGVHFFITLPVICALLGRRNPYAFLYAMFPAVLTAWSTASSSATLPVTMECCEDRAGVNPKAAGFVLPLGATINMDGTALYEAVGAIFIAQAFGVDLSLVQVFLIFITATLASIGAAGIPQAGLFTMVIVLNTVGLPLEGISLILVIDWLLDRFRTATNVWGDAIGAAYIDRVV